MGMERPKQGMEYTRDGATEARDACIIIDMGMERLKQGMEQGMERLKQGMKQGMEQGIIPLHSISGPPRGPLVRLTD